MHRRECRRRNGHRARRASSTSMRRGQGGGRRIRCSNDTYYGRRGGIPCRRRGPRDKRGKHDSVIYRCGMVIASDYAG